MAKKDINLDQFFENILQNREIENGTTGNFKVNFFIEGKNAIFNVTYDWTLLFSVKNLTKEAARKLFNQFDENNVIGKTFGIVGNHTRMFKVNITDSFGKEHELNHYPNIFTDNE